MNFGRLVELFAVVGELVGDSVANVTGRDIDIVRIRPVGPRDIQWDGRTYTYVHKTLVSFDGVFLGNARVYWSGEDDYWQELADDRMKEILHRLNYRVLFPRYHPGSETLCRVLLASAPKGNLIIAESLFIGPIEAALIANNQSRSAGEVEREVGQFLAARLLGLMGERGIPADVAAAVVPAEKAPADVPDAARRAKALLDLKASAQDFQQLTVTLKRVMNILPPDFTGRVEAARLKETAERELHGAVARLRDEVTRLVAARDYLEALRRIGTLRPVVDRFFTDVMVMVEDPALRTNRLALLAETAALFSRIADFRHLTTA